MIAKEAISSNRGSKPGERRGGRKAGTPNRVTGSVKDMIEGALKDLGGQEWLVQAARESPHAFMALIGKLIPKDLNVSGEVKHSLAELVLKSFEKADDGRA